MKKINTLIPLLATAVTMTGTAFATPVPISTLPGVTGPAPFRITGNVTLSSGTDYLLDQTVYVDGGTITIQPGVLIPATDGASLVVTRGSQIFAQGTAQQPIIFTSLADYNHIKNPTLNPAPEVGDNNQWGGIVILGNAPINFYVATNPFTGGGSHTNRGENVIEGIAAGSDLDGDGLGDLIEYGQDNFRASGASFITAGTPNPADNSGVFKFVSIRFGGDVLGLDNEVNGLTLGGVGSGTVIENVEVFNNTDDGFEWFGGTVNCKNLVSAFNQDEDFDMDEGYSGNIQFAFGIRQDEVDGAGNVENASELDGGNGSIFTGTPFTTAQVWNATLIGAGRAGSVASKGTVFRMKDNFAGQFHNCVFDDFGQNLVRIDDVNTAARVTDGTLKINNSHWGRYNGVVAQGQLTAATTLANGTGNTNPTSKVDPKLRGISRTNNAGLDPRPAADSPLYNASLSTPPAGLEVVNYRGAFGSSNWASGWTKLSTGGFFGNIGGGAQPVDITTLPGVTGPAPFRITSDVTLISGVDYLLDETIYVDGGDLTIEPGVLIQARDGASLVVTRGSQIFAEGTAEKPIIFTSEAEYNHIKDPVNNPAPEVGDNNQWGGIVILGNAPINFYVATNPFTGGGSHTNRGENVIEGIAAGSDLDGDGLGDLIEYGQDNFRASGAPFITAGTPNPADNSGVFKFVSIRFGGDVLGLDNEVNGLTLGGVGSGTVIENVEVFNNTDDGFEWFGGTVNCKNLVSAFNQDEDFDMDEGYSGNIQFAFGIRHDEVDGASNVENASELDGGNGSIFTGTPFTTAQVWNATLIGAGRTGSVASKGTVFRMKDNFAGQFHNCVFDDFGQNLVRIDDVNTAARVTDGTLKISNSHWGRYNGVVAQGQLTAATTLANGTGNTNPTQKINPLLGGISRDPNGGLDPRPNTFSPLYGASLSTPPAGLEVVNYRGAFGSVNWAKKWTRLDSAGFFGDLATVPAVVSSSFADADNDGISDSVESANSGLGLDPNLSDAAVLGTLKTQAQFTANFTAGQTSVTSNPSAFNLFSASSIQDISADDIMVQRTGTTVNLSIPVESSNNLVAPFTPVGNATLQINGVTADREFYRFRIPAAQP